MNKRFLFLALVLAAIIAIALTIWYVLRPALPEGLGGNPAVQPRVETPFDPAKSVPQPPATAAVKADPTSPEEKERQAQEALKRQAMDISARLGTYSNADDFDSLRENLAEVTPAFRTKLETRLAELRRDHPAFGSAWSQTMRTLSAELERKNLPLAGKGSATVYVQAQQTTDDARTGKTTELVKLTVTFLKQGDVWMASDITLQILVP